MRVEFDGHTLDIQTRELLDSTGSPVALEPQAFDVLAMLVANRHRVVTRAELLDEVWGSQFVTDSALSTRIKQIRQAVGDDGRAQRVVKTFHGRGFRFVAEASVDAGARPIPVDQRSDGAGSTGGELVSPLRRPENTVGPLIGRSDDLDAIVDKSNHHRLVTVVGPGGIGKKHLLHHVGARLQTVAPDGAVLVELAPLRSGEAIGPAVLAALGVGEDANVDPFGAAIGHLRGRSMAVLLDNAEHVLDEVVEFGRRVVEDCPDSRLVVTSRRPLGLTGEAIHELRPLDESACAELFVRQGRLVGVDLRTDDPELRKLCRAVDGVPLAVRVLAGRAHVFSLGDLSDDLLDHLRRTEGSPAGHGRHESVELALAWSIDELDATDRRVLEDLSVMAGWFDLEAAGAVAGTGDLTGSLMRLQGHSLLATAPGRSSSRFRLLEPIRLFSAAARSGEADQRHADHYLTVAERAATAIDGPAIDDGFRILGQEWPNLRVAFHHAEASGDLGAMTRMVDALANYAEANLSSEVHRFAAITYEQHVAASLDVPLSLRANHARFVSHRGDLAAVTELLDGITGSDGSDRLSTALMTRDFYQGDLDATREVLATALAQFAGTGGFAELTFDALAIISGLFSADRMAELAARLESLGTTGGDIAGLFGRFGLAVRQLLGGDTELAVATLSAVEEAFEERRNSGFARLATSLRSNALLRIDDPALMRSMMTRSLERGLVQGAGSMMAGDITRAARLLAQFGRVEVAMTLASAAEASGFAAGAQAMGELAALAGDDPAAMARAESSGRYLTLDQAARTAIDALAAD